MAAQDIQVQQEHRGHLIQEQVEHRLQVELVDLEMLVLTE